MLSPQQLASRLRLDHQVVAAMNQVVFDATAYSSRLALAAGHDPIGPDRSAEATAYRVEFTVPTLIGPGQLAPTTTVGVDLNVRDYPYAEPSIFLIGDQVPYSPHFKAGMPVCIGEIWTEARGNLLLGQLLVHIARLLNWDETIRGGGYEGWNGEAIAYHRAHYGSRPLNPELRYPTVPVAITHGVSPQPLFAPATVAMARRPAEAALFGRHR